jgi:hypothetical protein
MAVSRLLLSYFESLNPLDTETLAVTFNERGCLAIEAFLDSEKTDEIERALHGHMERVRRNDLPGHVV